jgi:hypothetical protein
MSNEIILIGTHQARLRGLLHEILYTGLVGNREVGNDDVGDNLINEIFVEKENGRLGRFMNCAVIKMIFNDNKIKISLEYQGQLDPSEEGVGHVYYITGQSSAADNRKVFPTIEIPIPEKISSLNNKTIYVIRHGQAAHNPRTKLSKMFQSSVGFRNTSLTDIGREQAQGAAENISNDINNISAITYLFASDLRRTRETVAVIYSTIYDQTIIQGTYEPIDKNIYILPCSHEVYDYSPNPSSGSGPQSYNSDVANKGVMVGTENTPTCTFSPIVETGSKGTITFNANSSYYMDFYKASCRVSRISRLSSLWGKSDREKCSGTNMLIQAAKIIDSEFENRVHSDESKPPTKQGGKKTGKRRQARRKTRKIKSGRNNIKSRSVRNERRKRHSRK